MKTETKQSNWLEENFEELILMLLLVVMTLIMGLQVFSRYVLRSSLVWSEELTRYMFIWCGFLSIAYCCRKKLGLRVDMIQNAMPKAVGKVMSIIALLLEGVLFIYLVPFAWRISMLAVETGRLSPATQVPMWVMQSAPLIGFGLAILRIAQRIYLEATGREAAKTVEEDVAEHYVEEAEIDLKAGHEEERSWTSSWTGRWTKKTSRWKDGKKE